MSPISTYEIPITTDAAGAGTALSVRPLAGEIVEIRLPLAGTALTTGGSADFTFTRNRDGGTVLAVTDQVAPFQFQPRPAVHSVTGGTTAYAVGVGPVTSPAGVPINDHLKVVIAQGALSKAGTIFVHVRE